jgi:ribulose-phosphate 3-epimerase
MMKRISIAPSILSADLLKLEEQVKLVSDNGADLIHVDVMDGRFVPNITFGPNIVEALKRVTNVPLDVHLMIVEPEKYFMDFINAGADILTFHQEATFHSHRALQMIREAGIKAGISINPGTPVSVLENIVPQIDLLLLMSVNPGFGGQKFIPRSIQKIASARKMLDKFNSDAMLEVDGGINTETAELVVEAGADTLVAGSAIFKADDIVAAMTAIKEIGKNAAADFA